MNDHTKRVMEDIRAARIPSRVTYKRSSRFGRFVAFFYTFVAGMFFASLLHGYRAALIGFIIIVIALFFALRE
jgi:hypothetical protein